MSRLKLIDSGTVGLQADVMSDPPRNRLILNKLRIHAAIHKTNRQCLIDLSTILPT